MCKKCLTTWYITLRMKSQQSDCENDNRRLNLKKKKIKKNGFSIYLECKKKIEIIENVFPNLFHHGIIDFDIMIMTLTFLILVKSHKI